MLFSNLYTHVGEYLSMLIFLLLNVRYNLICVESAIKPQTYQFLRFILSQCTERCMKICLQLRKDFEDDKQRAVSRALAQAQRDVENSRKQTEERCKEELAEETKKLVQKHKTEISATKKKQWVRRRWPFSLIHFNITVFNKCI